MAKRQDLRQTETGDLFINSLTGDFQIIESDAQHIGDIIQAVTGDYKEFPLLGVNLSKFLNSINQSQNIDRVIRLNLTSDRYVVDRIDMPASVTDASDITVYSNEPTV
jgi:hypothetical protein